MRTFALLLLAAALAHPALAQPGKVVEPAAAAAILQQAATPFPKFVREFNFVKAHDPLIKQINFVEVDGPGGNPASAAPNGVIRIDLNYLQHPRPNFDDNRLIVVLYHEIGHLHYFEQVPRADWTSDKSEQAAFEYSLLKTRQLAENGDCLPLVTGLKFMKLRSQGTNLEDPHVRALKRIVPSPLYLGYLAYARQSCKQALATIQSTPPMLPSF